MEKELNKGFSLFNFPLIEKGAFKLFIKQLNYQKLKGVFLKPTSIYTGPLDPHVKVGC
jgi:hypothetical protein